MCNTSGYAPAEGSHCWCFINVCAMIKTTMRQTDMNRGFKLCAVVLPNTFKENHKQASTKKQQSQEIVKYKEILNQTNYINQK